MPFFRGLSRPLCGVLCRGYIHPRTLAGLVGLYRGIVEGAIYWGLFLCSRSCCCACAFLLGIAEGLPLSLWLSFIAEGLPLAPVSLGYISLTAAGACPRGRTTRTP